MSSAKDIRVAPIAAKDAHALVKRLHYSGKFVSNSQLHFGVFLSTPDGDRCYGVMSFGPSMDKRKSMALVSGTTWNGFLELNRMAFGPELPRNSESRAIAVAMRLIRKHYPHVEWVVSFADATQCGDGTIYRASGFVLTSIKKNRQILNWNGRTIARKTLDNKNYPRVDGRYYSSVLIERGEAIPLVGFQLRYVYFLNPAARSRLTVPILPFSAIAAAGAGMYRGEQRAGSKDAVAPPDQGGEDA